MVSNELINSCDGSRIVGVTTADGYGRGSIITPEAVVLNFELAGIGSRAIAYTIDLVVQFASLFAFFSVAGFAAGGSEVGAIVMLLVGLITIVLGYPIYFETFRGGRTLGRMVVGTRVVSVEGAPIRFRQAFIRALLGVIDLLISAGGVAVVTALLNRRGQRLGDMVAGTMVIRDSTPTGLTGPVHFWAPPYLAQWAQTVDTSGLGNDGYQLVRDFLTRETLSEPARAAVGLELCDLVSERLPHAARPANVPPHDYLTAIATAAQGTGGPPPPPPRPTFSRPAANLPPPPGYPGSQPYAIPPEYQELAPPGAPTPTFQQATAPQPPAIPPEYQQLAPPRPAAPAPPVQPAPAAPVQPAPPVQPPPASPPQYEPPPNDGGFATPG